MKPMTDAERMALEEGRQTRVHISADAQFIASEIVTHMWVIFVLLPIVGVLLIGAMRGCH
jgi:nitrate reductase NapE component